MFIGALPSLARPMIRDRARFPWRSQPRSPIEGPRSYLMRSRSIGIGLVVGLAALLAAWGAWRLRDDLRCRALLGTARHEMEQGRYARARAVLKDLLALRPGWDEA